MIYISRLAIDGLTNNVTTDNKHPSFSFTFDFINEPIEIKRAILFVNNHEIDVTNLTSYIYEFSDLEPLKEYEAKLSVYFEDKEVSKSLKFNTGFMGKWDAPFISDPKYFFKEKKVSPKVLSFLKNIKVNKKIKSAKIYVTCFGVFNLYINGLKKNKEYFLPGFTSYKHQLQYVSFDITNDLNKENEIIIDVAGGWAVGSFGYDRRNRISENKQSLSSKIIINYEDDSSEIINTDESWLVSSDTPYIEASLYDGEGYNANKKRDNFHQAKIYKTKCHPQIISLYGSPVVVKKVLPISYLHSVNNKDIYDLKQNLAGVVNLKIKKARKNQKIVVKHAEILNEDGDLNTSFLRTAKCEINYICKDGEQSYSPSFTYMGFRYISIEGIAKEDIDIEVFVLSSDLEELATFECDNELINRLNKNVYYSSISNLFDIPTDCPQRDERMGWTGDIAIFAPTSLYNFEMTAFFNKWLKDLRSEQLKTGGLPNTIPSQGFGFPLTMPHIAVDFWGDSSILVPLAIYNSTGNKQILIDSYESMKKYVKACLFWANLFSVGDHRYIWHTPSMLHFGDWVAPDVDKMSKWQQRSIYTATCSLMNTTTLLSKIASILENKEDEIKYLNISKKVKKAFNKILTDGNGKTKEEFQTAYVLPLMFDMFDEKQKKNALENLVSLIKKNNYHIGTGFPGTPCILFVLADNGYVDVANKMLLCDTCPSWLYEVKVGGTSIWERWDGLTPEGKCPIGDDGTDTMISYNHYASGAVASYLYTRIAGLDIIDAGYKTFRVKPILCESINYVKTKKTTPYGNILVEYHINDNYFNINIRVPLRSECELNLPNGDNHILKAGNHTFNVKI